jgi:iron complex transport system substrate-binding protein
MVVARSPLELVSTARARLARALLAFLVLAGLAAGWAQPRVVVDDLGRDVELPAPAQRIVAMMPTHAETVCALGACDRLVGVDAFSNHPAEVQALPSLGSPFDADVEAIVALEPDLVLADEYSGLAEALARLGVPVYAGTAQTIDDIWEVTGEVGALLGLESEAALLVGRTQGRLAALAARSGGAEGPSVFVEIDATPYSVGPGSFLGSLLTLAGARNIVPAGLGDFPQVDPELVIDADPDLLVLLDAPYGESAARVAARPGWGGLSAVRAGAVIEATADQVDLLTRAGPRVADALELLQRWLASSPR